MKRKSQSIGRSSGNIAGVFAATSLMSAALLLRSTAAAAEAGLALPVSAPAIQLPSQDVPPPPLVSNTVQPAQPTLPDARLPQYQLNDVLDASAAAHQFQDGKLAFQLTLPAQSLVVEATVTIDGQPFANARERRIEQILGAVVGSDSDRQAAEDSAGADELTPPYTLAATADEYVRRYIVATGRDVSAGEVRWLLASRIDGPTLLRLNDNFQRVRASQRPVFDVLDLDRDGTLGSEELQRAPVSLGKCDLNQDQIVDYLEIARVAGDPRRRIAAAETETLISQIGGNVATPDVSVEISFDTRDASNSTIRITGTSPAVREAVTQATVHGSTIMLLIGEIPVAFSAVQGERSDQISIGAVNDGYPILPVLDPNDDGRLTIRELRGLMDVLRAFDRDRDGSLTAQETQPPIRVCFGLGPNVHRELAGIRSSHRQPDSPSVAAPEWFARMDNNKDNDLARDEFLGTDDQFAALDADSDGLIAAQEAVNFNPTEQQSILPDASSPATPRQDME